MKITGISCHLMQAQAPAVSGWAATGKSALATGRNWFFVTVSTDAGVTGTGEGSGWPRLVSEAVADLTHLLVGENAFDTERIWQKLRVAMMGHGQTGVVGMGALAAIDTALWDIKGQALGVPIWQLLGGQTRPAVPYYVHTTSPDAARAAVASGIRALKVGGIKNVVERAFAIREAVGPEVDMMVDLHGPPWLTPSDAVAIGRALEPLNLLFLEEPVAPDDMRGWRLVRDKVALPLATGERLASLTDVKPLLEEGLVDILQPDTGRFGGLTQMRKLAGMAEAWSVMIAPHAGSLGPVAEVAATHLLSSIPNALILERLHPDWSGRDEVLSPNIASKDGFLFAPSTPGLGVALNLDFIAQHPSRQNTAIATGGWNEGSENETTYLQARRPRSPITKS